MSDVGISSAENLYGLLTDRGVDDKAANAVLGMFRRFLCKLDHQCMFIILFVLWCWYTCTVDLLTMSSFRIVFSIISERGQFFQ